MLFLCCFGFLLYNLYYVNMAVKNTSPITDENEFLYICHADGKKQKD